MTRAQIEKKFGVKVRDDSYYDYRKSRMVKAYKIYSADGCPWENGLRTMAAVEQECREWEVALKEIAIRRYGK